MVEIPVEYLDSAEGMAAWVFRRYDAITRPLNLAPRPIGVSLKVGSSLKDFELLVAFDRQLSVLAHAGLPPLPAGLKLSLKFGGFRPLSAGARVRPAGPGSLIGVDCPGRDGVFPAGSLGALVRRDGRPGELFILSANHIIALNGDARRHGLTKVVQPCRTDVAATGNDEVASTEDLDPICELTAAANRGDWALAKAGPGVTHSFPPAMALSTDRPIPAAEAIGKIVIKAGAATGVRRGRISGIRTSFILPYASLNFSFKFVDQLTVDDIPGQPPFAETGDSGSLAVTEAGEPVGLVYADGPFSTVICPLAPMFDQLRLSFVR